MGVLGFLLVLSACGGGHQGEELPITTSSDRALAFFLEGRTLIENLRSEDAREVLDLAIEEDPLFAQAHLYRYFAGGSMADQQRRIRHATSLRSKVSEGEALFIDIVVARRKGKITKWLELSRKLVQLYPDDKRVRVQMAQVLHFGKGEFADATKEYRQAIRIDKNYAPPYNLIGYAYSSLEQYGKAEKALQKYIELIPEKPNPYDSMADLYTKLGRLDEAGEYFAKAVEKNPHFTVSQRKIGVTYIFQNKFDEARQAFRTAYENESSRLGELDDLRHIVLSYLYEGQPDQALKELQALISAAREAELEEVVGSGYFLAATIYLELGRIDDLMQVDAKIAKLIESSNFDDAIIEQVAEGRHSFSIGAAASRGDFEKARELLADYLVKQERKESPYYDYHALAGYIELLDGNAESAIEHLTSTREELATFAVYYLARAYEAAGHAKEARETFQAHAKLFQHDEWYALTLPKTQAMLANQ